jgi:hypothetical protein
VLSRHSTGKEVSMPVMILWIGLPVLLIGGGLVYLLVR